MPRNVAQAAILDSTMSRELKLDHPCFPEGASSSHQGLASAARARIMLVRWYATIGKGEDKRTQHEETTSIPVWYHE